MHLVSDLAEVLSECESAQGFVDLAIIAIRQAFVFQRTHGGYGIVCGPITTGGHGKKERNIQIFFGVVNGLRKSGFPVFSQEPYEPKLWALKETFQNTVRDTGHCMRHLEDFYGNLFTRMPPRVSFFLPGWESSSGARWEHDFLRGRGVKIVYLTWDDVRKITNEIVPGHITAAFAFEDITERIA